MEVLFEEQKAKWHYDIMLNDEVTIEHVLMEACQFWDQDVERSVMVDETVTSSCSPLQMCPISCYFRACGRGAFGAGKHN